MLTSLDLFQVWAWLMNALPTVGVQRSSLRVWLV